MSKYQPPRKTNVALSFSKQNTGTNNLNFGENELKKAELNAVINTSFSSILFTHVDTFNQLKSVLRTSLDAEILAQNGQLAQLNSFISSSIISNIEAVKISQFCSLNSEINTHFNASILARFDINYNIGVFRELKTDYFSASAILLSEMVRFSKPIFKVLSSAFYYDPSIEISFSRNLLFERGISINTALKTDFDETYKILNSLNTAWDETENRHLNLRFSQEQAISLSVNIDDQWKELVRKRKNLTFSHVVAQKIASVYYFYWDDGLEIISQYALNWEIASSIYYRKSKIDPWPKPENPDTKSKKFDLNFCCNRKIDRRSNVLLNFDVDHCKLKPSLPHVDNKNWWYIVNNISVVNLRNGEEIKVISGSYSTDRSQWCWSYSLSVPQTEISKIEKFDILEIKINGSVHHMMYEEHSRSCQFPTITFTLTGRSQTALLESKYSPVRSYLQENERSSVQLAQAELERVNSETGLDWQLIDDLGWIVETESLSYTNLPPIEAIKLIAEAGGGFIYSEKKDNRLSIRPLYKKAFWEQLHTLDYDRLIPESLVLKHSESYDEFLNFNAITLTNPRNGNVGQVKRRDTAGDVLLEPVSNPLFNAVSMGGFGKAKLAKSARVELHDFDLPIFETIGECVPGEVVAFNGLWWGIVDTVSVSFTYSTVNQSISVERTVNE